ncbi:MAG TPA: ATP phosphoribosyltransferase [Alphaproteobacteria bacterium]|nr:ATP phosphoribosyltransferase [Alphaproteobacteria bacterium]
MDLKIGRCRLSIAGLKNCRKYQNESHVRVATKYVNLTKSHFAQKATQAECIKLNGSIELAPKLGICDFIIDLVSTGETLKANNMEELEVIMQVSSRLIINKQSYKTMKKDINNIVGVFN